MIHAKHLAGFPKPLSDCQTCHKEDETLSEQHNWFRVPTMESCGSCHNNITSSKAKVIRRKRITAIVSLATIQIGPAKYMPIRRTWRP